MSSVGGKPYHARSHTGRVRPRMRCERDARILSTNPAQPPTTVIRMTSKKARLHDVALAQKQQATLAGPGEPHETADRAMADGYLTELDHLRRSGARHERQATPGVYELLNSNQF